MVELPMESALIFVSHSRSYIILKTANISLHPMAKKNLFLFISPLFNQVGYLQMRPGQEKAKQCDTYNNTELHME